MEVYDIKVSATVIIRGVEANNVEEAKAITVGDLAGRFPKATDILNEFTVAEDVTGVE